MSNDRRIHASDLFSFSFLLLFFQAFVVLRRRTNRYINRHSRNRYVKKHAYTRTQSVTSSNPINVHFSPIYENEGSKKRAKR